METADKIKESLDKLYTAITERHNAILEVFNDFFGADKVDMQNVGTREDLERFIDSHRIEQYIPGTSFRRVNTSFSSVREFHLKQLEGEQLDDTLKVLTYNSVIESMRMNFVNSAIILIHFPSVRIINEHDRYVDINHLYAKVWLNSDGTIAGTFRLNRSHYPLEHLESDYMHSHICDIPFWDLSDFQSPCLGSGPIRNTIAALSHDYDLDIWRLFCLELSKYVTVESLTGVPYHRLEEIGSRRRYIKNINGITIAKPGRGFDREFSDIIKNFIKYFIKSKKTPYGFRNGQFTLGMSYIDYTILVSNEFIKWYNEEFNKGTYNITYGRLIESGLLYKGIVSEGKIRTERGGRRRNYSDYEGNLICMFKGERVTFHVEDNITTDANESILIENCIVSCIAYNLLKELNFRYGREKRSEDTSRENVWFSL